MMGATRARAACINLYETGITAQRRSQHMMAHYG